MRVDELSTESVMFGPKARGVWPSAGCYGVCTFRALKGLSIPAQASGLASGLGLRYSNVSGIEALKGRSIGANRNGPSVSLGEVDEVVEYVVQETDYRLLNFQDEYRQLTGWSMTNATFGIEPGFRSPFQGSALRTMRLITLGVAQGCVGSALRASKM